MAESNDKSARAPINYTTAIVLGMMTSVIMGLLVFDDLALGFAFGIPIGVATAAMGRPKNRARQKPADGGDA